MRITIIGSGNVATHLAAAFKNAGHKIVQVYSRDMQNAALLAYHVKAEPIDALKQISADTDLFLIAVKDDAIAAIAERLTSYGKLIAHTSGATSLQALSEITALAGVFYPLQTFSKTKEVDFWAVPLCVEGATLQIAAELTHLAQTISNKVHQIDSDQRKVLHLSAVFACNFPNYLYAVAQQLLTDKEVSFDLLRPLILETAQKVQDHLPGEVQTGPAIRNDEITIAEHLQMLENEPQLQHIYGLLSQEIIKNNIAGQAGK